MVFVVASEYLICSYHVSIFFLILANHLYFFIILLYSHRTIFVYMRLWVISQTTCYTFRCIFPQTHGICSCQHQRYHTQALYRGVFTPELAGPAIFGLEVGKIKELTLKLSFMFEFNWNSLDYGARTGCCKQVSQVNVPQKVVLSDVCSLPNMHCYSIGSS